MEVKINHRVLGDRQRKKRLKLQKAKINEWIKKQINKSKKPFYLNTISKIPSLIKQHSNLKYSGNNTPRRNTFEVEVYTSKV